MAVGKNKRLTKSKKGAKKKIVDPFTKKEWYDVKVPTLFKAASAGKTLITKTQGTKIASEGLKGRVFELNIADLNKNEDQAYRKIKVSVDEVQGSNVLTSFHGLEFTRDKQCSLIRKWQTLIESQVDVRTSDGYTLRVFVIAFTKKMPNQVKKTCYAQSSQIRAIRAKISSIVTEQASKSDLRGLASKFVAESLETQITKAASPIFPLQNVFVRKVKVLKKPKFDIVKLMEWYQEAPATTEEIASSKAVNDKRKKRDVPLVKPLIGTGGRL